MSDLLHQDDDAIDPDGPTISTCRYICSPNRTANNDYTIGGHPACQQQIRKLVHEYDDFFGYNVKGKATRVTYARKYQYK